MNLRTYEPTHKVLHYSLNLRRYYMEWYHGNNDTTVKVINHGHTQIPWYYWSNHGKKENNFGYR